MAPPKAQFSAIVGGTSVVLQAVEIPKQKVDTAANAKRDDANVDIYLCGKKKCYHASTSKSDAGMAKLFAEFSKQVKRKGSPIIFRDESTGEEFKVVAMDNGVSIPDAASAARTKLGEEKTAEMEAMEKEFDF